MRSTPDRFFFKGLLGAYLRVKGEKLLFGRSFQGLQQIAAGRCEIQRRADRLVIQLEGVEGAFDFLSGNVRAIG